MATVTTTDSQHHDAFLEQVELIRWDVGNPVALIDVQFSDPPFVRQMEQMLVVADLEVGNPGQHPLDDCRQPPVDDPVAAQPPQPHETSDEDDRNRGRNPCSMRDRESSRVATVVTRPAPPSRTSSITIRRRTGWLTTASASLVVNPAPENGERAWNRADPRDTRVNVSATARYGSR